MRTRGFTLIELMIVIAIIGILAAVIIPALNGRKPIGARDFNIPSNAKPVQTGQLICRDGFLQKDDGTIMTKDGVVVRC